MWFRDNTEDQDIVARNRKLLTDALEANESGNVDRFWSIFDDDVVIHESSCVPYGGAHYGLEATKQAFGRMSQLYSGVRAEIECVLAAGDIAIHHQTVTLVVRDSGETVTLPIPEILRFRDGKVVEWRAFYFDPCVVAKALAVGEAPAD